MIYNKRLSTKRKSRVFYSNESSFSIQTEKKEISTSHHKHKPLKKTISNDNNNNNDDDDDDSSSNDYCEINNKQTKNVKVCEPSNYDIDYNEEYKIVSSELLFISYESQLESVNKMIRSNSELFEDCLKLKTQMQNLASLSVESLIHQGNIISFNILKILYINSIYR